MSSEVHPGARTAPVGDNAMRWFCLSLLFAFLSLAAIVSASWPSAAQDKNEFAGLMLAAQNELRQKYNAQPLVWDNGLAALAQDWAKKIAASGAYLSSGRR